MRHRLFNRLFVLGFAFAFGCGSDPYDPPEDPAPADFALRATVGPEGGRLEGDADGPLAGVALDIPAGALDRETEVVLRATVDGTPLAITAERIGPHVAIEPAELRFALPARLTVPFDPTLREAWSTPHEDCRVWLREGEGWARADALETTPEGVTVAIEAATVAAAGVLVTPRAPSCRLTGTCRDFNTCLGNGSLCLTQLPSPQVAPFETASATVEDGFLYFTHVPSPNQITLAKHDLLSRVSQTDLLATLTARPTGSVQPRGRIQITNTGDAWVGMVGFGNLRFRESAVGRFDPTFSQLAAGVVVDDRTQSEVVRLTQTRSSLLGRVGSTSWVLGPLLSGERVFARSALMGRTTGGREDYVYLGTSSGSFRFDARRAARPVASCRGLTVNVDADDETLVAGCSDGTVEARIGSFERPATFSLGVTIGSMALTPDNVLYVTDPSRAEIVRVLLLSAFTEGPIVVEYLPLTDAEPGTREHDRMLPRAIRFDDDLDRLVLVTRGVAADGTPEIYSIDGGV
ncbi:MAG: hypothetical protein H6721_33550 [Sandaracinus sp.]|nr:hypothetical protein [Sandaracinus sp.]MCB9621479.1 hypothetical protein [Sandaracinus sp.]MCB9622812.1 hypothetical protein [Sandaracinus sp.]MCB9637061.1 hypothetical protein [Sandaracinus sp.]